MSIQQFDNQNYLNLETTRKNGDTVKTPVWFVNDGGTLLVWTEVDSGKAKRIRRDGKVRVVPSTASGETIGKWVNGTAIADSSPNAIKYMTSKFKKKYGMMFIALSFLGRVIGRKHTTLRIRLE